jgi:hypothetical protein
MTKLIVDFLNFADVPKRDSLVADVADSIPLLSRPGTGNDPEAVLSTSHPQHISLIPVLLIN